MSRTDDAHWLEGTFGKPSDDMPPLPSSQHRRATALTDGERADDTTNAAAAHQLRRALKDLDLFT